MLDDHEFTVEKLRFKPGDTLVLYTDGVSEAENDGGDEYGVERVQRVIEQYWLTCPDKLVGACKQQLDLFRGGRERFDDETLLAMQYMPSAAPSQSSQSAAV